MQLPPELQRRIDQFLGEVKSHLAGKPVSAQNEVLSGLRDHIYEALQRAGTSPGLSDLEKVIAEMDPPESFAEVETGTTAPPQTRAGSSNRWFLLALAFLLINGYGVWHLTRPAGAPASLPDIEEAAEEESAPEALRVVSMEQADISAEREISIRIHFSDRPNINLVPRFIRLVTASGANIEFSLLSFAASNTVMIRTAPVYEESITCFVEAGLPSATKTLPLLRSIKSQVALQMNMMLRRVEASSPVFESPAIRATFSAFAEARELARFIDVEPAVKYTVETGQNWSGGEIVIRGDFTPGKVYNVTYKKGLPAVNGASLAKSATRSVQIPNRGTALQIENPGRFLSPQGALAIPVASVNLSAWTASLQPVFRNNLVQLSQREYDWQSQYYGLPTDLLVGEPLTLTNTFETIPNEIHKSNLRLRDLSANPLRGAYWLSIRGENYTSASRLIVITDLGISVRIYEGGLLAWINSLSNANAIANAAITVYSKNNQVIGKGKTDARGIAKLTLAKGAKPYVVVAENDSDLSMICLEQGAISPGDEIGGPAYLAADGVEASVFTERGIYRPGESVFMQTLARDRTMNAPRPFPALFRVIRPDGRTFKDEPVMLNEFGSAHTSLQLPEFLPTGRYRIQLVMPGTFTSLGETEISLEDFVPPQIRVEVKPIPAQGVAGKPSSFHVNSWHLFGSAASGLKAGGFATVKATPFAPTNWPGWTFGDDEKVFAPIFSSIGSKNLDENGSTTFSLDTSDAWRPPAALEIVQQAVVFEAGGRSVTAYGSARFDPYPFYIGVQKNWEGMLRVGVTQVVKIVEVAPDGSPRAAEKPLVIELFRARWNSVLRQNREGRYAWESERELTLVREDTVNAGGEPRAWNFAPDTAGDFLLLVRDPASGASTRIAFSASSPDQEWVEWSRQKPGRIDLTLDRERYQPGDTARVMVKAPFSGTALLTIESDSVREERLITLEKNTAEFEISIAEDFYPNVYCVLTLIRPARAESVWSTHRAMGAVAIPVAPANRALRVRIDAPERIPPQTPLDAIITVTDDGGKPVAGEVTVMAVDEGICMLTDFITPDPNKTFTQRRRLTTGAYDIYNDLIRIVEDQIDGTSAAGGDGESGIRRRLNPIKANRFKPVALWHAPVTLDENGTARVRLDVPEFTGELRLMAVAANATQAGSAHTSVKVKRDLVAQTSLPRFLAIGDQSEATLTLFNESETSQEAKIVVTCGGPLRVEQSGFDLTLQSSASTNITVMLIAGPGIGKAHVRLDVQSGASSFTDTIEIAVRPTSGSRIEASSHIIAPGESVTIAAPKNWIAETIRQSGAVSALPALQFARALDYVVSYPYGCLEQTASGAFPLLHAPSWIAALPPGTTALPEPGELVKSAITRVLSMQQVDGGFGLWPFERRIDARASLYAIHFLIEARNAGYSVPDENMNGALLWLRSRIDRSTIADASSPDWKNDMAERAVIAHLFALAGKPDAGWNGRLREISGRLDFASQAHIASALLLSGEPREALAIINSLGLPAPRTREVGQFDDSDIRDASLIMSAWLDVEPAHPSVVQIAHYIQSRMKDGHWGTTHDNAMALLAFGKYAARLSQRPQTFAGVVTLPDGRTEEITHAKEFTWNQESSAGTITISNRGPGLMHAWSRQEGIAAEAEPLADTGVSIRRQTFDMLGQPLDASARARGDMIIVQLTVDTLGRTLDQLVIEDLLPAGWEIENPNLATSQQFGWITQQEDASRFRDARDDRMLIFTGAFNGTRAYYYAARAITVGEYTHPAVTVSGMYEPEIRSVSGGASVVVKP